jgi:hypothetical protein
MRGEPQEAVRIARSQSMPSKTVSRIVETSRAETAVNVYAAVLVGIAMSVATDKLFVALSQIIASARAGDPFISANARRLQTIGWALFALQLIDIPSALLERFFPSLGSGAPTFLSLPEGD